MTKGDKLVRILHGAGVKSASLGYTVTRVRGESATIAEDGGDETFTVNTRDGKHSGLAGFWSEFIVLEDG